MVLLRITACRKLEKDSVVVLWQKDLSDLTSTIMADCAQMETASSHFIPELVGACISTAIVAVGMFFFNWRMALAALWVLPVSFLIVGCSGKVQKSLNQKQMELKMACADGIQECLESARDLHAYNAEDDYMRGLDVKIKAVEKHAVVTELGTAVFVGSAQMILKLGIATWLHWLGELCWQKGRSVCLHSLCFCWLYPGFMIQCRYLFKILRQSYLLKYRVQDWMKSCRMRCRKVQKNGS